MANTTTNKKTTMPTNIQMPAITIITTTPPTPSNNNEEDGDDIGHEFEEYQQNNINQQSNMIKFNFDDLKDDDNDNGLVENETQQGLSNEMVDEQMCQINNQTNDGTFSMNTNDIRNSTMMMMTTMTPDLKMIKKFSLQHSSSIVPTNENDDFKSTPTKKRKSFEVKNLWYYLRNNNNNPNDTVQNPSGWTTTTSSPSSSFFRFKDKPTNKQQKNRNSSIPENVFLGLRTSFSSTNHHHHQQQQQQQQHGNNNNNDNNNQHNQQRYSVPNIIQKDKAQKTWERMMKMKNDEKKSKRHHKRLHSLNENKNNKITTEFEQQTSSTKVVVIVDDSSPTRQQNGDDDDDEQQPYNYQDEFIEFMDASPTNPNQTILASNNEVILPTSSTSISTTATAIINDPNYSYNKQTKTIEQTNNLSEEKVPEIANHNRKTSIYSEMSNSISFDSGGGGALVSCNVPESTTTNNNTNYTKNALNNKYSSKLTNSTSSANNNSQENNNSNINHNNENMNEDPFDPDDVAVDDDGLIKKITETTKMKNIAGNTRMVGNVGGATNLPQREQPDSCSSFSSLNNDDCLNSAASLYSQCDNDANMTAILAMAASGANDGSGVQQMIDPRLTRAVGTGTGGNVGFGCVRPPVNNYQRKYSLAVPGEPRYMHRRESSGGSRSPLNSSCGGLSHSEMSTPSPSCSNSINDVDDQSSYSSHSIHEAILEHTRKPIGALSVDSLFLKQSASAVTVGEKSTNQDLDNDIYEQEDDDFIKQMMNPLSYNRQQSKQSNTNVNHRNKQRSTNSRLVDELCRNFIHLKTSTSTVGSTENFSKKSNSNTTIKSILSNNKDLTKINSETDIDDRKRPIQKRRKSSVTAMIASLLLPESICQKIGASVSSDRIHQHDNDNENDDNEEDGQDSTNQLREQYNHHHTHSHHHHKSYGHHQTSKQTADDNAENSGDAGKKPRHRKGSIAQITSASANRIVRMLRRTHSAGTSKDVPSYALFLSGNGPGGQSKYPGKHRKSKSRKRRSKEKSSRTKTTKSNVCNKDSTVSQHEDSIGDGNNQPELGNTGLEDMKQRLRFLSRRHTDSSLHSSTVRPSKDEVEKWSKSFRDLMANRYGSALFRAFLCREFSDENIEFWLACEEYRKIRSSKLRHKAKKIYDNYVAVRSPREVNLDHQLRADIQRNLSTPSKFTFDEAQKKIQSLLESDSYVRFLQSDLYTDLVMCELNRNNNGSGNFNNSCSPQREEDESVGSTSSNNKQQQQSSRRQSKDSQKLPLTPPPFNT